MNDNSFDLLNQLDEVVRQMDRMTIHQLNSTPEGERLWDRYELIRRKLGSLT